MNRKEIKRQRLRLLHEQEHLEEKRCERCKGNAASSMKCPCPAAVRIREIGDELNALARKKRRMPETLNREGYMYLKGLDWVDKDIARHYGVSSVELNDWKVGHGIETSRSRRKKTEEEPKVVAEIKADRLTVEVYQDLKAKGMSDKKIGEQFGMKQSQVQYWRKKNGMASVRDAKQKRIEVIADVAKAEKGSEPVVKVEEKDQSAAPVDVSPLHKRIEQLENENDKLRLDLLNKGQLKFNTDLEDQVNELTKKLERSKESNKELWAQNQMYRNAAKNDQERIKRQEAAIESLQADVEALRPLAAAGEELAVDWRKKYESEHLRFLEANAVIMEQKELRRDAMQAMNEAWDDDIEQTKKEMQALREQNAYLSEEMRRMKCKEDAHETFKEKAFRQVEKKNKLIYALMDYYREEA